VRPRTYWLWPGLEHDRADTSGLQRAGGGHAGLAAADHDDICF
jgi:hypothetical protein